MAFSLVAAGERLAGALKPPLTITPPPAGIRFERDVEVRVRDGTTLRVNVFRPEASGRYPVLMCAHPYGKDNLPRRVGGRYLPPRNYRILRQPEPLTFSAWTSWEAPDPGYWVPRGYALVNADLRGFGHSDGEGAPLSDQEAKDYYDLVEWAARQPWSSGRVGLNGVSYLAISQYKVAALQPPHLRAICPWEGLTDAYRDLARPGGIREDGFMVMWSRGLRRHRRPAVDIREEQLRRPLLDQWWRSLQPALPRIEVPALICASFSDHSLHSRGSFEAFRRIASADRWLYTHRGGKWTTYYSPEALATQSRFFDCFLKDTQTGIPALSPVRLAIHDRGDKPWAVRQEPSWPPPGVSWTPLYLHAESKDLQPARATEPAPLAFDTRSGRVCFSWQVAEDVELVGPMKLRLHLEVQGANDVSLFAGVRKLRRGREILFEGSYGFGRDMVTKGWQKASHRGLDPLLSEPWWPVHTDDVEEKLRPGVIVSVDMALLPSATLFRRGDVLRLDIQGRWFYPRDPLRGQFPARYEPSRPGICVLHCGGPFDAHLLVPLRLAAGRASA
jgi:predicted acyl esterase